MSTDIDTPNDWTGTPTTLSTALALTVGVAVVALLVWQVNLVLAPVLVGSVGAGCLAVALWLVGHDRWRPVGRVLAGLLSLPASLGLFVAILGGALLAVTSFLPLQSMSALSLLVLTAVTQVGVVIGCVLAALGILVGIRNTIDEESVTTQFWVTLQTALPPSVTGAVLAVGALLAQQGSLAIGTGLVDGFVRWLFVPGRLRTHLATTLLLVTVTALTLRATISALPLAELFGDSGTGDADHARLSKLRVTLGLVGLGTAMVGVLAFAIELTVQQGAFQQVVGYGLYQTLTSLSTAPAIRSLLLFVLAVATGTWLIVSTLRRMAANSAQSVARRAGPFVGGILVTLACLTFGTPIVETVVSEIGWRLPTPVDDTFFEFARATVDVFGAGTLTVIAATLLFGLTAGFLLVLRFAVFAGYLDDETAGYSLASGGLFVAAAFAGALVSEAWVLFAALVGSFFVWDMGRFGTTMGREVGQHAQTRDAELVHAGGTLGVGVLGIGGAYALQYLLGAVDLAATPTTVVALVGVLAGIVLLVTALR